MDVLLTAAAVGIAFLYLYAFLRSYVRGNDGLNGELFGR